MPRQRLTPDRIKKFSCPKNKQQAYLFDEDMPRLAIRATSGSKSFIYEGKLNRKTIRITIGDIKTWTPEDARIEARRLQSMVDVGTDPRVHARELQQAKKNAEIAAREEKEQAEANQKYTLKALCETYTQSLKQRGKHRSSVATRSCFKCHLIESHPEIANLPAKEVTGEQLADVIRTVRESGKERMAGLLRSYFSAAYNAARKAKYDTSIPKEFIPFGILINPSDSIPAIPVRAGMRTLSADELSRYISALNTTLPDRALLVSLLAGGQRLAQLLRAKVSDYTTDTKTLRLWDSKGKRREAREHLLPLAPKCAAIIEELIGRAERMNTQLLFSTTGKVTMVASTPGRRIAEIDTSMGGEHFDQGDIRRTCETMLAGMGISREIRAQLLSHGLFGVQVAHYDRHSYAKEKRETLIAWEKKIDQISSKNKKSTSRVKKH